MESDYIFLKVMVLNYSMVTSRNLWVSLGLDGIREMLLKSTIEEKKKLENKLSGALVSIKFDGVTRLRSHFLGISAQYFNADYGLTTKRHRSKPHQLKFRNSFA